MNIAIVGAGVSGLVTAHLLSRRHDVTVFEANDYAGGHTHTVRVDTEDETHWVDTGFIVFNDRNYPNFERLLKRLGIGHQPTHMSFAVTDESCDFEYSSSSINGLYAKRAHLATPWFHRMVAEFVRFQRHATRLLSGDDEGPSLGEWLEEKHFSRPFIDRLIVPMASAVWSADQLQMWGFPARFLVEFFYNHGMLGLRDRPEWRTVVGGSHRYVEALTRPLGSRLRLSTPIREIRRNHDNVAVCPYGAEPVHFDEVVIATHSDQALAVLVDADALERQLLGAIPYQANEAVLHTDVRMLPLSASGVGQLELPPARGADRKADCDLPHESAPVPTCQPGALRHPEPYVGHRSGVGDPLLCLRPPDLHARGIFGPGPPPRDKWSQPHPFLRRLLGLGLPRGRRDQRGAGGRTVGRRRHLMYSAIYEGTVHHQRSAERQHHFQYRVAMPYLDLAEVGEVVDGRLMRVRPGVVRFRRRDYLGEPDVPLIEAVRTLVAERLGTAPQGPVRLLTNLRCLGHCFNPVSFYYCFAADGETVEAVIAEVTNTPWAERHVYVLPWSEDSRGGGRGTFDKALHVSPFMGMDQHYSWVATPPGDTLTIRLQSVEAGERVFAATLSLRRRSLDRRTLRWITMRYPAPTQRMLAMIYLNGAALRLKGVRVRPHP